MSGNVLHVNPCTFLKEGEGEGKAGSGEGERC